MTVLPQPARRVIALLLGLLAGCQPPAPAATTAPADDDSPAAALIARITPAAATTVGIVSATAGPGAIRDRLPLYGTVRPNAESVREVVARFPGTIERVAKATGDAVGKGELLATIESNDSLQSYAVRAPMAGTVTFREADPGEQAGAEVLFTITDLSTVWIELSLFPADAARVGRGQRVTVASVDGRLRGEGRIDLVGALGQAASQTLTARVTLPNPDRQWTPGLFVNAEVELGEASVPVAVLATALQTLDGAPTIFVPVDGGYAPRNVAIGRGDGQQVEIVEGLAAGEAYVAAGSFVVKAELGKAGLEEDEDDAGHDDEAAP